MLPASGQIGQLSPGHETEVLMIHDLPEGSLIGGRFLIKKKLGAGGMGVVYLADDKQLNQPVAFKVLAPAFATNTLAMERFKREVRVVRQLDHPAITRVYDTGKLGSTLFYTMEYVDGTPLNVLIKNKMRLELGPAARIVSLIADVIDHAHAVAVHRDLSPDNVIILNNGNIKLLDFGQAKTTTVESDLTRVGIHLGKILYAAPEQRANAKDVDHRADIYSLGAIAYEMIAGKAPIVYEPLAQKIPSLPAEVDTVIAKAMAADPDHRYQAARPFAQDLIDIHRKHAPPT